jgi:hypothetical protein
LNACRQSCGHRGHIELHLAVDDPQHAAFCKEVQDFLGKERVTLSLFSHLACEGLRQGVNTEPCLD